MGTASGAARYSHGVFTRFTTGDGLTDNSVTAICADSSQGILLATGAHLHRFVDGKFYSVNGLVEAGDGQLDHLVSGSDGSVWLGFRNAVVKKWKNGSVSTFTPPENFTGRINQLYEDPRGTLWLAQQQWLARLRDGKFESVPLGDGGGTSLGVVYSVFIDREDNVWVGFQSSGLARLTTKQLFTISAAEGLPNESTRSVFEDSRGTLWIGTVNGLVGFKNGNTSTHLNLDGSSIGAVRSIAEDADGNIWIGADQDLLVLRQGRLRKLPGWNRASEIRVIYRDPRGHMWVGTNGEGLFEFANANSSARHYGTQDGLADDQVRAILSDRNGALWISTHSQGISKYLNGRFVTYTTKEGLANNRVTASHEDDEGALWFATRGGLSRFKDGKFFTYTTESGMLVNFVYSMLDDERGNFWFSCAQGLFRRE